MNAVKVVVASAESDYASKLVQLLSQTGYQVIKTSDNAGETLRTYHRIQPDLIVIDIDSVRINVRELLEIVDQEVVTSIIALTKSVLPELVEIEKECWYFSLVFKPENDRALISAIDIVVSNHERVQSLQREIQSLKDNLETRKLVERAKRILMEEKGLKENEAFRTIQKESMNTCLPMKAVAQRIIDRD